MPALTSGKVLVTGANGYVAAWVIKDLLENGYAVRGTVRSESKATYLREHFKAFGDTFEIVIVADITKPAVQGTRTVLASVLLHGAGVRRVFITSSAATLSSSIRMDPQGRTSQTIDESSWDDFSVKHCEEKGAGHGANAKYRVSKVLAERAAWEFYENAKQQLGEKGEALGWDLVVFCPPADWYKRVVKGESGGGIGQLTKFGGWAVDVRGLAHAFVLGLEKEEASGIGVKVRAPEGETRATWISALSAFHTSLVNLAPDLSPGTK